MATFEEAVAQLPFSPLTENGQGFLPPLLRTMGHLLYLLGRMSDTPTRRPTDNQIREELDSIKLHLEGFTVPEYLSETGRTHSAQFVEAFNALDTELGEWDSEARIANMRSLTNRAMQLTAFLDREVLGLRESDPGQSL